MKTSFLISVLFVGSLTGVAQQKSAKTTETPAPAVAPKAAGAAEDTLYHRRAQMTTQDFSKDVETRVALPSGYAFVLKDGQHVKLMRGDSTKMPYFLLGDQPATRPQLEALNAADVTNVSVWKRQKATAAHGEKARHGVVIVRVKKPE
ncbi:MAG: hypothetical protein H7Y12_04855 [Sphingobacteriaceae bacterium]|nr:hypothetical protein [Cytophagaceae bacterium]